MENFAQTAGGWLLRLSLWVWMFTAPAHDAMAAVIGMVALDFVSGVWAAKKRGEPIVSYKLRHTVTRKLLPYEFAILSSHLCEVSFIPGIPLMSVTAGFIASAELASIMENMGDITGLNIWAAIKDKLQPVTRTPPKG